MPVPMLPRTNKIDAMNFFILCLCRSIVESHGGKLWAEAGPGGRFSFLLPRDEPEPGDQPPAL